MNEWDETRCGTCGGDQWLTHGDITIRCPDCATLPASSPIDEVAEGTADWCARCRAGDHSNHSVDYPRCDNDSQFNADCRCPRAPLQSVEPSVEEARRALLDAVNEIEIGALVAYDHDAYLRAHEDNAKFYESLTAFERAIRRSVEAEVADRIENMAMSPNYAPGALFVAKWLRENTAALEQEGEGAK